MDSSVTALLDIIDGYKALVEESKESTKFWKDQAMYWKSEYEDRKKYIADYYKQGD